MKKLQYGMVGGGPGSFIGDAHRRAINIDGQAQLVAGCFSRTPEKCRQTGAELGIASERCYASFEEMAKAEVGKLDYVVVVVPNVSHYPVCKAFLEAGINVSYSDLSEASLSELRNYISLLGISFTSSYNDPSLSFRPNNLPKKTKEEENLHRKMVYQNRQMYFNLLKKKKEIEEQNIKLQEKKHNQQKIKAEFWNTKIIPNWSKMKNNKNIKKYFYEGIPNTTRGKVWALCIGNKFSITKEYYDIEANKSIQLLIKLNKNKNKKSGNNNNLNNNNNIKLKIISSKGSNNNNNKIIIEKINYYNGGKKKQVSKPSVGYKPKIGNRK